MTCVIDASVALKWFVDEEGSLRARSLVASGMDLIAPDLVVAEVCNAAWRLVRVNVLPEGEEVRIANRIGLAFSRLWPLDGLAPLAVSMARELGHPIYDCFYLALAEREMCRVATADLRFIERVAGSPWQDRIVHLEAFPA
ncbi:type II toxin-antitoxin system VapC family toxin [Azospirillum sp. TSO22-1]|uniref:type II toxin-antitoxin system VapC family toxin n=1 Tax=Azospirillum sp. TSO22-1 TaxID=716789 RepID=UPI000D643082|nr:type II toxin-antitoxin system VapC family toxin [Azospirillum sp. TSO22-1]